MSHNLRLAFIIIGLAVMGWFIAPTVRWYFFTSEEKKRREQFISGRYDNRRIYERTNR